MEGRGIKVMGRRGGFGKCTNGLERKVGVVEIMLI